MKWAVMNGHGFVKANLDNHTVSSRCIPQSYEDADHATRERQIHDQNRCPPDYELVDMVVCGSRGRTTSLCHAGGRERTGRMDEHPGF